MGNRTNLYVVCMCLFPLGFVGFVVGFGCPVWTATSSGNIGLWQQCLTVFVDCQTQNFNSGGDWMIGVRAVEIFALVMYAAAAIDILYENTCTNFRGRPIAERIATGIICILGGVGGLSGIIVYVVKLDTLPAGLDYGWALALVAASSALAVLLGIGFCVSGFFLEKQKKHDHPKGQINGQTPHLTSNDENYELSAYASRNAYDDNRSALTPPATDNLPGYAVYNGMLAQPGMRNSLPLGVTSSSAYPGRAALPPAVAKSSQYYSLSDDRLLDPAFDLSEGFSHLPARTTARPPRTSQYGRPAEDPYHRGRPEDRYSRGEEDPYNRIHRPPRAGYNDPFGFDRVPESRGPGWAVQGHDDDDRSPQYVRGSSWGAPQPSRDSYMRSGRF